MIRKYVLPLAALCGFVFAIYIVRANNRPVPVSQPVVEPPAAPFASFVSGAGLIESASENIAISTPVAGLVTRVFVRTGDRVHRGDPLFQLDDRAVLEQLAIQESMLLSARTRLDRLQVLPRPEEVPPVEAQVQEAASNLADLTAQLAYRENVPDKRAVSQEEMSRRRFAVVQAESKLRETQAQLALLKAGAWGPDIEIARNDVRQAAAQLSAVRTDLSRLTVRAPMDGQCLQVKVHTGEFAQVGPLPAPLILFGDMDHLRIRVDIDENEAWRVDRKAPAVAYARGNTTISTTAEFVRLEPYVIPKESLTGSSSERVDTRVLQVLYQFDRNDLPLYAGQQMDVFIQAPPVR